MRKYNNAISIIFHSSKWLFLAIISLTVLSCNEDYANLLNKEYPDPNGDGPGKNNKVLLITVDGLSGDALTAVGDAQLPTLTQMKKNALFSYRSLSDFEKNQATYPTSYANIFTGVTVSKHGYTGDAAASQLEKYPSFISRIKASYPSTVTAVFSTNETSVSDFVEDAAIKQYASTDEDVVNDAVANLTTQNSDIVVVNLSEPESVGSTVNYDLLDANYLTAIKNIDAHVKKIKTALESRPNYRLENWLVVVTSTLGAHRTTLPVPDLSYNDSNRNTFTLFYNKNFNSVPIANPSIDKIPFSSNAPVYNSTLADNNIATLSNDGGLYNFGNGDFTLRFTMKGSGTATQYPVFLSKSGGINANVAGWKFFLAGKVFGIQVEGGGFSNQEFRSNVVNDGAWHNVAVKFITESGVRKVKVYVDGIKAAEEMTITTRVTDSSQPIRIGRNGADDANIPDIRIAHLQIYRGAWSEADIIANSCKVEVTSSTPNYNNLVGYWPSNEGQGNLLRNHAAAGVGKDFVLQGKYSWTSFNDVSALLCPTTVKNSFYQTVPNAVDITYSIYAWMGVPVQPKWSLDGKAWSFSFNNIKP